MAPPSTLLSMSFQVAESFSRGDLSPETKNFPPITRGRRAVSTFVTLTSRMMKGTAFQFTFRSKIALCRLSRRALTEISLFFFF